MDWTRLCILLVASLAKQATAVFGLRLSGVSTPSRRTGCRTPLIHTLIVSPSVMPATCTRLPAGRAEGVLLGVVAVVSPPVDGAAAAAAEVEVPLVGSSLAASGTGEFSCAAVDPAFTDAVEPADVCCATEVWVVSGAGLQLARSGTSRAGVSARSERRGTSRD